jgi:hypothetical protein
MMLFVIQLAPFITRTVLVAALTVACLNSGMAQAQELTAHEPSAPENDSVAEASKPAANPLANVNEIAGPFQFANDLRELQTTQMAMRPKRATRGQLRFR